MVQRLFLTILIFSGLLGCQLGKPIKPMTPSQFRSGELSRSGHAAMENGEWDEAEKKLEEAVRLNKKDIELRRHYAEALWIQGKQTESLQQLTESLKRGGEENASIHLSLAEKYLFRDDPATAMRHAEIAVRWGPREYKSWALRAKATWLNAERLRLEEPTEAVREEYRRLIVQARNDYYRAISLSPNNREIMPELAAVQMLCGQPEHALITWQNLQECFPPESVPADLLRGKAESYIALRQFDEALDCLKHACARAPDRPEIAHRFHEVVAMARSGQYPMR